MNLKKVFGLNKFKKMFLLNILLGWKEVKMR